jgi:hypothetical protein
LKAAAVIAITAGTLAGAAALKAGKAGTTRAESVQSSTFPVSTKTGFQYSEDFSDGAQNWEGQAIDGALSLLIDPKEPDGFLLTARMNWRQTALCRIAEKTRCTLRYRSTAPGTLTFLFFNKTKQDNFSKIIAFTGTGAWQQVEMKLLDLRRHFDHPDTPSVGDDLQAFSIFFRPTMPRSAELVIDDVLIDDP